MPPSASNCFTSGVTNFGESINQFFNSNEGVLGMMSYGLIRLVGIS